MKEIANFIATLKGKPVAVFGLARSGLSTIRAFRKAGAKIIAWDDDEKARAEAKKLGAMVEPLNENNLKTCAFLVLAPGVPLHFPKPHAVVEAAKKAGTEIICDLELFHRLKHRRKTIGVTGTNGKSTTTALIHHILKNAGVESVMGGNIGLPVFDLEMPEKGGVFVFELSSYQLDLCPTFRPDIAALLNITPDHIDRHGTMEKYIESKKRVLEGKGTAVVGIDDKIIKELVQKGGFQRKIIPVSVKGDFLKDASPLKGLHNYQNVLAAAAVCKKMRIAPDKIRSGLQSFPGLPHRQFPVRVINGVTYINDSKATNAEAASKALMSYENIYWIAGGRPKEGGLGGLEPLMKNVKESFLIGEAMNDFAAWMKKNNVPFHLSKTIDAAVQEAHRAAQKQKSSVVLLSPACASFDQFSSYEERGEVFTNLVNQLEDSQTFPSPMRSGGEGSRERGLA